VKPVIRFFLASGALAAAFAAPLAAQQPDAPPVSPEQQAQIRQRLAMMVKTQLGLTDEQLAQLGAVNKKYEGRRFELLQQEREIRITARAEVLRGDSANQQRVAKLIDQLIDVQKQRLAIFESEQKDLAKFLTPVQRAKYLAIQERVRKRLEEMRQQRGGGQGQQFRRMQRPPPGDSTPE